jgi:hypothetical protein
LKFYYIIKLLFYIYDSFGLFMSILDIFSGWGGLATHKINIERKLADMISNSEHLSRMSGQTPLTWYEFQNNHEKQREYSTTTDFSSDGLALGGALGIIGGMAASAAAITLFGVDPAVSYVYPISLIGGGVLGGTLGGAQYRSSTDHREDMVDAYAKYLEAHEQQVHHAPDPSKHGDASLSAPPSASLLRSQSSQGRGSSGR